MGGLNRCGYRISVGWRAIDQFAGCLNPSLDIKVAFAVDTLKGGDVFEREASDVEFILLAIESVTLLGQSGFLFRDDGVLVGDANVIAS